MPPQEVKPSTVPVPGMAGVVVVTGIGLDRGVVDQTVPLIVDPDLTTESGSRGRPAWSGSGPAGGLELFPPAVA